MYDVGSYLGDHTRGRNRLVMAPESGSQAKIVCRVLRNIHGPVVDYRCSESNTNMKKARGLSCGRYPELCPMTRYQH